MKPISEIDDVVKKQMDRRMKAQVKEEEDFKKRLRMRIDILNAWLNGETIEFMLCGGKWQKVERQHWNYMLDRHTFLRVCQEKPPVNEDR